MRRWVSFGVVLLFGSCGASSASYALPDEGASHVHAAGDAAAPSATPARAASPAAAPAKESDSRIAIGVGIKISTLGAGAEAAIPLSHHSNIRVGLNMFNYSHTFNKDGVAYNGSLNLRSVQATYDFFPVWEFHISPGVLLYNGTQISANASVPGGRTFTLNGIPYMSDPRDPVAGTGKLAVNKVAPMVLIGVGNLVPRSRHFSTSFEIGAAYQGPPRATLNLTGSVCDAITGLFCRSIGSDPTVQSNVVAEQNKINKSASPFRFYPVVSFGIGYKF